MACPPGNCAAWGAFRLCKPLPPIILDGSYSPDELQLLWFCWRARSTGEYGGNTPVDLGFNTPGLIDIAGKTNIAAIVEYCNRRGTLVAPFTNFSRFGSKFNLPNYRAAGVLANWVSNALSPTGGGAGGGGEVIAPDPTGSGGSGGGGATCPCTPDPGDVLTVVVCTEFDCDDAEPKLELSVCGGTPPYSWTNTAGDAVQSGTNNRNVKVTPKATTNDFGTTIAYNRCSRSVTAGLPTACATVSCGGCHAAGFDCDNDYLGTCAAAGPGACNTCDKCCCDSASDQCALRPACSDKANCPSSPCVVLIGDGVGQPGDYDVNDARTQAMKDGGCIPCTVQMDGAQITVTDADSNTVVTTITT